MTKESKSDIAGPPVQQSSQLRNYPMQITVLTLIAYVIGLGTFYFLPFIIAFIFLSTIVLLISKSYPQQFVQPPLTLLSFLITTFIFGLIHAYTLEQVRHFININAPVQQPWPLLQIYMSFMAVYYYFEFQLNNCFHHRGLNWYSFLIYHSKPYFIAQTFCLCEHLVTKYLFGFAYKDTHPLIYPSLLLMILGQGLRIAAFFTCKSNFTHLVRYRKHPNHQLITHGVYSFFRHPSYTGYFYFAVSSQLFLGNWVSAVGFFIVLVKFFNERIHDEELMLASFFEKYLFYKKKTHILIPFVKSPESQDIMKYLIRNAHPSSRHDSDDENDDQKKK